MRQRQLPHTPEEVWLLHGLGRSYVSMEPMKQCLEDAGYNVSYWRYSSLDEDILTLGDRLKSDVNAHPTQVHLVTHSMGGIIVRAALRDGKSRHIDRVVMLAPPNQGSALASELLPFVGDWIPVLRALSAEADSLVNQLGPVRGAEVGIIAGARDLKVSVENTKLEGAKDHIVVDSQHTFIMARDDTCKQVTRFLKHGSFRKSQSSTD